MIKNCSLILTSHLSKVNLTREILKLQFETIMGGLTIVYPQGLPEFDPVRQAIENNEDLEGTAVFYY